MNEPKKSEYIENVLVPGLRALKKIQNKEEFDARFQAICSIAEDANFTETDVQVIFDSVKVH